MSKPTRHWYRIFDDRLITLLEIAKVGVDRELTREETNKKVEEFTKDWSYYGPGRVQDYQNAVLFKDGSMLVCITTASFAGSFTSYDNISVQWWHGTP